ncbi:MAG TPA: phosphoribosylglycinamide formyltransferase, partial [Opitutae bacterium]|nr:phosphoribosylglycinamide formyltransferase [Opitutae bacterium]
MRVLVLGSGQGSNAKAILEAQNNLLLGNAQVVGIISNIPSAGIIDIAEEYSVPTALISCSKETGKLEINETEDLTQKIKMFSPDLIVLAGFMKIIPSDLIDIFPNKIINLHPSLLPSFKGLNAIERAFNYGVKISGCTVHCVNAGIDDGPIIAQAPVR